MGEMVETNRRFAADQGEGATATVAQSLRLHSVGHSTKTDRPDARAEEAEV